MATKKPTTINAPPAATKARKITDKEILEKEIATQAQARFIASAAIDAAVAMREAGIARPALSKTALKQKLKITLADIKEELLLRIAEGESVFTICGDAH